MDNCCAGPILCPSFPFYSNASLSETTTCSKATKACTRDYEIGNGAHARPTRLVRGGSVVELVSRGVEGWAVAHSLPVDAIGENGWRVWAVPIVRRSLTARNRDYLNNKWNAIGNGRCAQVSSSRHDYFVNSMGWGESDNRNFFIIP